MLEIGAIWSSFAACDHNLELVIITATTREARLGARPRTGPVLGGEDRAVLQEFSHTADGACPS